MSKLEYSKLDNLEFYALIFLCKLTYATRIDKEEWEFIENKGLDWYRLYQLAKSHSVLGAFTEGIRQIEPITLNTALRKKLFEQQKKRLIRNLEGIKLLKEVSENFIQNDIPFLLYKGPLLTHQLYKNIGLRSYADLDVLIRQEDLEKINLLLIKKGFKPKTEGNNFKKIIRQNHELTFINSNQLIHSIDIHWRFIHRFFVSANYQYLHDHDLIKNIDWLNLSLKTFHDDFLPVALIIHHGGSELWLKLKYSLDFALLSHHYSRKINWENVDRICQDLKIQNFLYITFAINQHLFQTTIPKTIETHVKSDRIQEAALKRIKSIKNKDEHLSSERWITRYLYRLNYGSHSLLIKVKASFSYIYSFFKSVF